MVLEKIFKDLSIFSRNFHFLFGKYIEFWNHTNKIKEANPRHISAKN
jgi:hypothetical protein